MGDEWLVDENIDVDIQQLKDFAKAIQDELETNFRPSFENGVRPMLTVQAPFGGGGLKEGKFFRGRHDESRSAVAQMLGDAMKGLVSLSTAAASISAEYLTGDALAQATNDDVYNAFSGVDGQQTLNDLWQQGGDEHQNPANAVPGEATDPVTNYAPVTNACPVDGAPEVTPEMAQPETVGEGSGSYQIQGDDEQMHGDEVARPDVDVRS